MASQTRPQFGLMTVIVLLFELATFVALNVKPPWIFSDITGNLHGWPVHGFPWGIYYQALRHENGEHYIKLGNLLCDAGLAAGVVGFTGLFLEWWSRRTSRTLMRSGS